MSRAPRVDVGDEIYHVLNRANARMTIFDKDKDFKEFEEIIKEAKEKHPIRILSYCLMPNHWHFILYPENDGDLNRFMHWVTLTHTQRWHAHNNSIGYGHLYQGRYKSFLIQKENYFLQAVSYVERNAMRANLVEKAEDWRWSSLWRREHGTLEQKSLLSAWPIDIPENYLDYVNRQESKKVLEFIRGSIVKSRPLGDSNWVNRVVDRFGLKMTIRKPGRPKKGT
jgi:putative transposase